MHSRWSFLTRPALSLIAGSALLAASLAAFAASPGATHATTGPRLTSRAQATTDAALTMGNVTPNKANDLDCNGWSRKYQPVSVALRMRCTDPRGPMRERAGNAPVNGKYTRNGRFIDNGHYVGHDEPSVNFISNAKDSGNTMTYYLKLPRDPARAPDNNGKVIHYAELSPAPWFGLPMCDPKSYPQNPCTPDSDSNIGANVPNAAGSAFMELQFYPPGFAPLAESVSCSRTFWCAALNIDSIASQFNFVNLNPDCEEPINFAFLQTNGKPAGPPSPQLANFHTLMPNAHTLRMHDGDVLRLSISDPRAGFTTTIDDLTTHKTGTMTASKDNGFMNTDFRTCEGSPHTFHAEYATASRQNQTPWGTLPGAALMEQETGHAEACHSLANRHPLTTSGVRDNNVFDTCVGSNEGRRRDAGEGGCNDRTGICKNAKTQGTTEPIACPSRNFNSGQLCEFADGICLPQGTRRVTLNGQPATEFSPVNFCAGNRFQNGDLDFDGIPYQKGKWPNGSRKNPISLRYAGPFDQAGKPYPRIRFETNTAASEFLCNIFTGLNCTAPPLSAKFYPFWSLTRKPGQGIGRLFRSPDCIWNFGASIPGVTLTSFGKDRQYGVPSADFGGTLSSVVLANPQITFRHCPALTDPKRPRR